MDSDQEDSSFESEAESVDSDRELQIAFKAGLLKTGLNYEADPKKPKPINDVSGLKQALEELQKSLPWVERLDLTVKPAKPPRPLAEQLGADPDDLGGESVHDDFKREMKFYRQAQGAALEAIPRLRSMGISTKRPEDYFAEMAKSDIHMKKVREKLLSKQMGMERSEKAKKLRDLRKYGKKVQHEVLQKRQKEKKDMLEAVKKYRKGHPTKLDFLGDDAQQGKRSQKKQETHTKKKKDFKNEKFGYGGQKKRSKGNTAESTKDMAGYSVKKHGQVPSKYRNANKKGGKTRPGKGRRTKMRSKGK